MFHSAQIKKPVIPTLGGISSYIDSVLLGFFSPLRFLQNDNSVLLSSRHSGVSSYIDSVLLGFFSPLRFLQKELCFIVIPTVTSAGE
ncbi:hypothetical protein GIHI108528_12725 [Gillisia hiemivivida]